MNDWNSKVEYFKSKRKLDIKDEVSSSQNNNRKRKYNSYFQHFI